MICSNKHRYDAADKAAEAAAAHPSSTLLEGYKPSRLSEDTARSGAETALAHGFMVLPHAKPPLKI